MKLSYSQTSARDPVFSKDRTSTLVKHAVRAAFSLHEFLLFSSNSQGCDDPLLPLAAIHLFIVTRLGIRTVALPSLFGLLGIKFCPLSDLAIRRRQLRSNSDTSEPIQ